MNVYIPYIFYATPFVVAAGVLIRAQIEKMRPTPEVDKAPVMSRDDPLIQEVRSHPLQRQYISYTV